MHPETAARRCQLPACNSLTASPPAKTKQFPVVQLDESAILKPLMSNVEGLQVKRTSFKHLVSGLYSPVSYTAGGSLCTTTYFHPRHQKLKN